MKNIDLINIFIRSLFIQASLNFRGMQNLGFAFTLVPVASRLNHDMSHIADLLTRHLQSFNTHPYLAGSIIGSIVRMEEDNDGSGAVELKNVLMAPYAAIGDSFFWGALKPFAAIIGVLMAVQGFLLAPVIFFFLYNIPHFWIRIKGFIEGYRRGKQGVDFIRMLDLPGIAGKLRIVSPVLLGILAAVICETMHRSLVSFRYDIMEKVATLIVVIVAVQLIRKRFSTLGILYGIFIVCCLISL